MVSLRARISQYPRWVAASMATILIALLVLVVISLDEAPELGIEVAPMEEDQLQLVSVRTASPGWNAGLRPGDIVRTVSTSENLPVWVAFEFASGEREGQIALLKPSWSETAYVMLLGLGLECLVVGVVIFLRSPDNTAAFHILMISWVAAITAISTPVADLGQPWLIYLHWVAGKALVATSAVFFLTIPVQRWRPLRRLITWEFPLIVVFYTYAILADAALYDMVQTIGNFYVFVGVASSLVALVWPLVTESPDEERQLWPILLFGMIALALLLLGTLLAYVTPDSSYQSKEIAVLTWGLLPLGFVLVMLRRQPIGETQLYWPLFDTISNSINDALFVILSDGQVVHVNKAGLSLVGGDGKRRRIKFEAMVKDWVVLGDQGSEPSSHLLQRVLAGEVVHCEAQRLRVANGKVYSVEPIGTPVFNRQGQVDMAVLMYRDATGRKQAAEGLQEAPAELGCTIEERAASLSEANEELQRMLEGTIQTMALTVEMKDPYTAGHQRRVAKLACAIARKMGLSEQQIIAINMAATVHDIGKISVLADVFSKPGRLSSAELSMVRAHATVGGDLLSSVKFPLPIAQMVLQHHERVNGSGYPLGLSADHILLEAKIVAVADVVEAMTFERPYRPALGISEALEEVERNKGVLYDAKVVDACLTLFEYDGFSFNSDIPHGGDID